MKDSLFFCRFVHTAKLSAGFNIVPQQLAGCNTHLGKHTPLSMCRSEDPCASAFVCLHSSFPSLSGSRGPGSNRRSISLQRPCPSTRRRPKGPPKIPANPPHAEQAGLRVHYLRRLTWPGPWRLQPRAVIVSARGVMSASQLSVAPASR